MKKLFESWRRHLEEGNFRHPHGSGKPPSAVDKDTLHKKMAAARAGIEYKEDDPGSEGPPEGEESGWVQRYDERDELGKFLDAVAAAGKNATRPGGLQSVEEAIKVLGQFGVDAAKIKTELDFAANKQGIDQGTYAEEPAGAPETEIGPPPPEEYEP